MQEATEDVAARCYVGQHSRCRGTVQRGAFGPTTYCTCACHEGSSRVTASRLNFDGEISSQSGSAAILTVGIMALVVMPALVFVREAFGLVGGALS